jgi:hypothetical protein
VALIRRHDVCFDVSNWSAVFEGNVIFSLSYSLSSSIPLTLAVGSASALQARHDREEGSPPDNQCAGRFTEVHTILAHASRAGAALLL